MRKIKFKEFFKLEKFRPICSECGDILKFTGDFNYDNGRWFSINLKCPTCKSGFMYELDIDFGTRPFWV